MAKKTRERQLRKLAERRAQERRRRQRRRAILVGAVVVAVLAAGALTALALLRRRPGPGPTGPSVACGGTVPALASTVKPSSDAPPKLDLRQGKDYRATIDTSCGRIELDLLEDQAPVTVNNFVFLADEGFYDGLTFHRIATDPPVIQGGDPEGTGQGGPGYQLEDEIVKSLTFDHPGVVAMANTGIPDTNGSQFFITTGPARPLDGSYSIFGRVTSGIDVVRTIQALPATPEETPKQTVYIERVRIETR